MKRFYTGQIIDFIPTEKFIYQYIGPDSPLLQAHLRKTFALRAIYVQESFLFTLDNNYIKIIPITTATMERYVEEILDSGEKLQSCSLCHKKPTQQRAITSLNDKAICFNCVERIARCDNCEVINFKVNMVVNDSDDGYCFCKDCAKKYLSVCDRCNKLAKTSTIPIGINNKSSIKLCDNCRESLRRTECCGNIERENVVACSYCRDEYCRDHIASHEIECRNQHISMGMDISNHVSLVPLLGTKPGKYLTVNRTVGLEIETVFSERESRENIERIRRDVAKFLPKEYGIDYDGSLKSLSAEGLLINGEEFITPPRSLNAAEDCVANLCNYLVRSEMTVNNTCGIHVHVDATGIRNDPVKLAHLLRTTYAIEDLLFSINPPSRWNNKYCLPLTKRYAFEDFARPFSLKDFESRWYQSRNANYIRGSKMEKRDPGRTRYHGVNLHSILYRGTIEFRHHAGSLNAEKILGWVGLLLTIIEYADKHYNDQQIIDLYTMPTTVEKMKLFFTYFNVSEPIKVYMKERISKWNPRFRQFKQLQSELSSKRRVFTKKAFITENNKRKKIEADKKIGLWLRIATKDINRKQYNKFVKRESDEQTTYISYSSPIQYYGEATTINEELSRRIIHLENMLER